VITKVSMDEREATLVRRESEIAELERQVANGTYRRPTEKNFPPWLHWWSWDPDRDLPSGLIGPMKKIRWLFIGLFGCYVWNVIGAFALFGANENVVESRATTIALAAVFCFVLCPLAFEWVFFPIYKGMKSGRALKFFTGLIAYGIWWAILVFNLIGLEFGGAVGFIIMGNAMSDNTAVGVIALIFCIVGCAIAALMVWVFIWLIRYWRVNGLASKAAEEGAMMAVDYAKEHPDQACEIVGVAATHADIFDPPAFD
jgi:hypothetical protein